MRRLGAQRARDDRTHQLVGVQAALHQRFDRAGQRKLDGAGRRGMAVRHVLDRDAVEVQRRTLARRPRRRSRGPTSTGSMSPRRARIERSRQADRVARMDDGHLQSDPAAARTAAGARGRRPARARCAPAAACCAGARCAPSARSRWPRPAITVSPSLVDAAAVERDAVLALVARGHGDGDRQRVADAHRRAELQRLA